MFLAAQNGHVAVVQELLAPRNAFHNIEVNKATNNGCTPLIIASLLGHTDVMKELLSQKAKIDKTDNNGCTPLLVATENGHLESSTNTPAGGRTRISLLTEITSLVITSS